MNEHQPPKRTIDFKLPKAILGMSQLDPDRNGFVAACMDGVYWVDLSEKKFRKLDDHESYVSSSALSGTTAITSGYDGAIQWYELESEQRVRRCKIHDFWSWDMKLSPDGKWIASVTGQYLADGYRYEPMAEREPSVKLLDSSTGEVIHALSHVPSVQAVAFSHDSRYVAAGNLMGEVRVWDTASGQQVANWTTPDFTSWGIIKSHCYLGGIFAIEFSGDDKHLLLAGMGPMRDPMAGNGRQLWQKWDWHSDTPSLIDQTHDKQSGEGLMEALAVSPDGNQFVMGGRLRGGDWNVGFFDAESGDRLSQLKTGYRVTDLKYSRDGSQLVVVGTQGQPAKKENGKESNFGRVEVYSLRSSS